MSKRVFVKKQGQKRTRALQSNVGRMQANIARHNARVNFPMARAEKKNIDSTVPGITFGATGGSIQLLNGSQAGGLPTNRVGRKINMTSLYVRLQVRLAAGTTGASSLRYLVVYDKQANKAAPAITDVMTADNIGALQLLANSSRFKVLMDELVPCIGTAGPQAAEFRRYIKLNGLQTEYIDGAGAGTVADITTGSIYLIVWQDGGLLIANPQTVSSTRVRFLDL